VNKEQAECLKVMQDKLRSCERKMVFALGDNVMPKVKKIFEEYLEHLKLKPGDYTVEVENDPNNDNVLSVMLTLPRRIFSEEFLEKYDKEENEKKQSSEKA
jgi:hypothetical protein